MQKDIVLSETDKTVLNSWKKAIYGLADYMGEGYELVLHSLESMDHSVIAIINGYHTNRKIGSPITDLGLSMLSRIESGEIKDSLTYFSKTKDGAPLKSTTIAIRGERDRVIGLLCMNLYLNTPYAKIIGNFVESEASIGPAVRENYVENTDSLVRNILSQVCEEVVADKSILPSCKNKEIIFRCYKQGVFNFKDTAVIAADFLGISRNTIYLHLRNAKEMA